MKWLQDLPPWVQRLVTVAAGVGVGALGYAVPPLALYTTPAAVGLIGWALRHPADAPRP